MYTLVYSSVSERDLASVFEYICRDSREAAISYFSEIEKEILRLREFPEEGTLCRYPELSSLGIRVLAIDRYLLFYKVNKTDRRIEILRFLHSSQDWKNLF